MKISGFDHLVLCVRDVGTSKRFYQDVLGLEPREERPGKWSLHFGDAKISLQEAETAPSIAKNTVPGSGNFCLITDTPMEQVLDRLSAHNVQIVDGPGERQGAIGTLLSVYFKDPDGNLVEVSNRLPTG